MANDEHVARLIKQGVNDWNAWRQEDESIEIDLSKADLFQANLAGANLSLADLTGANLTEVIFTGAQLVETNLENANLTGCHIYGISAWNLRLEGAQQRDLVITHNSYFTNLRS